MRRGNALDQPQTSGLHWCWKYLWVIQHIELLVSGMFGFLLGEVTPDSPYSSSVSKREIQEKHRVRKKWRDIIILCDVVERTLT